MQRQVYAKHVRALVGRNVRKQRCARTHARARKTLCCDLPLKPFANEAFQRTSRVDAGGQSQ
eukprot:3795248-Alexandrium_andersonii.AAC.1